MTNWLKRLFGGGSDESSTSEAPEPATAPEPPSMPAEPAPPATPPAPDTSDQGASDTGNDPA